MRKIRRHIAPAAVAAGLALALAEPAPESVSAAGAPFRYVLTLKDSSPAGDGGAGRGAPLAGLAQAAPETADPYPNAIKEGWTQDFDAAVARALREDKLVFVIATVPPDNMHPFVSEIAFPFEADGGGRGFDKIRPDPDFKAFEAYMNENFVLVSVPVEESGGGLWPANPEYFERHADLISMFFGSNLFPHGKVYDPRTEKAQGFIGDRCRQKTALGMIDEMESAKARLVEGYVKKRVLDDPDAVLEQPPRVRRRYVARLLDSKSPELPEWDKSGFWEEDFDTAAKLAKESGRLVLACFIPDRPMKSAFFDIWSDPKFRDYASKNLYCVKLKVTGREIGKYKYKNFHDLPDYDSARAQALVKQFYIGAALCDYVLYNPANGRFSKYPKELGQNADEVIANIEFEKLKLR